MMATINARCSGFKNAYSNINGSYSITLSFLDLLRSHMAVGHGISMYKVWRFRHFELHKFFQGLAAIELLEFHSGRITLHQSFAALDGTEKAQMSNLFGMIFSNLVCEKFLGTKRLLNVDDAYRRGLINLTNGTAERGDLFGMSTNGDWHVVEAKGRSNVPENNLMKKAKQQASRITAINGQTPTTASGCITRVSKGGILTTLEDPESLFNRVEITADMSSVANEYYRNLRGLLRNSDRDTLKINDAIFLITSLPFVIDGRQLHIGLLSDIYEKESHSLKSEPLFGNESASIGNDGVVLSLKDLY